MSNPKSYVAFFDLDKTILSVNSGSVLVKEAYKNKLINTSDLLHALYLSLLYKFHLRATTKIIDGMGTWLKGKSQNDVEILTAKVAENNLYQTFRPEMLEEINFHRSKNAEIVILSSVISELCIHLSNKLSADYFLCTRMDCVNGIYTGFPDGDFCFGGAKMLRLKEYCANHLFNLRDAYYYADSVDDLPALGSVGHPVCVSPDKELLKVATNKGWKIIYG